MGVVNVTPDSFSHAMASAESARAGSPQRTAAATLGPEQAVEAALRLEGEGADLIDLGAESTRPGAEPVAAAT